MIDAYSPGARIVRARRLRGGIGARTQVVRIEDAQGERSSVVLRVYLPREALDTQRANREFRTIELVQSAGVPSPRPLFLDAGGQYFGTPAMLLSYLPGRSMYQPKDVNAWCDGLARAMLQIHALTPKDYDLDWLPSFGRQEIAAELAELRGQIEGHEDSLAREALAALEANVDRVDWPSHCLIHEDFWPGNTVWRRGRLTGVIDWANAKLGDPRLDLSQCRIDALLVNSWEVSDALRETYMRLSPVAVHDFWFIDLFQGLKALLYYEIWLIGYRDAGLTHVTPARSLRLIREFIRTALDSA
jgi:aminoglycoside phosphotransferase (APT) family kinase protein